MLKTNFWTQDQNFVYAWRYFNDAHVKIGVSTVGAFYQGRIMPAKTPNPDIELLGIVPCDSRESALALEKQLLQRFERVHPKRDLVYFTDDLRLWLKTNSIKLPLLEDFKQFQNHTEQHKLDNRIRYHFKKGIKKLGQEDYEGAQEAFEAAMEHIDTEPKPKHAEIYLYLGVALYKDAVYGDAELETYFIEAIRLNPNLDKAYLYLGKCKSLAEDLDAALDNFNKAIELNSELAEAYLERGYVYKERGDLLAAHADFSRTISLSGSWQSYFHRGLIDMELNRYECAIEAFDHVIEQSLPIQISFFNDGIEAAIEQKPKHIPAYSAYIQRALAKNVLGESQDARADYEKALALAEADGSLGVIYSVKQYAMIFALASQT